MINDANEAEEMSRNNTAETTLPNLDENFQYLGQKIEKPKHAHSPEITIIL